MSAVQALDRRLNLGAATVTNILAMIGVGPFLTIPLLLATMRGPQAMLGWILGAIVACCDGLAWAELGAAMPESGGGYRYVLEAYGPKGLGRLISFLFLWQILIGGPLVMATGAVGFSQYGTYLYPAMTPIQAKLLAMLVCAVCTWLLYRRIDGVGRWGIAFGCIVLAAALWVIAEGLLNGRLDRISFQPGAFHMSRTFWGGLGASTLYALYDYAGYYTVCFVGGEVVKPHRTIPRAIVVAIAITAVLYVGMNVTILSVMPLPDVLHSSFVVSDFIARLHGPLAASVMTILILITTVAGVFAGMLGFSRVPYAAAAEGHFLPIFARCHPVRQFPSVAVLYIGIATTVCCLLDLDALIKLCTVVGVAASLAVVASPVALRRSRRDIALPFRMWLYPLPILIAAAGWIYVAAVSGIAYIAAACGAVAVGSCVYLWKERRRQGRADS